VDNYFILGSKLIGRKGNEQVAGVMACYGPRVTMAVAVKGKGTLLLNIKEFVLLSLLFEMLTACYVGSFKKLFFV